MYRARDTRLGRTVAIKVPGAELQADRDTSRRAARDARIASVLSHPNIAALYEIGDEGGRLFLVFEFVPGEPLKRVIAGRPLNMRRAVDLATQIADALAEAHALEIVHGDLTPDTVMITPKGNAKILDFGFVRGKRARRRPASPITGRISRRSATLLFEMLTGRQPSEARATARRLDAARARRRLSARHSAPMRRAATKRPRRCAAELRSIATILDVRAASADPVRAAPLRDRRERGSRGLDRRWRCAGGPGGSLAGGVAAFSCVEQPEGLHYYV